MSKSPMSNERGASPIELALGIMLLVVPMTVMVLSVAPVFEHRNFAQRAAAEAARQLVLAGDEAESVRMVEALAVGMGVSPEQVTVSFCGGQGCLLERGAIVTVEVEAVVGQLSPLLPIGNLTVRAVHAEQVDLYRSRP